MRFQTTLKHNYNLIDLTALVDVVFLLLIFFLVTSDVLPMKSMSVEQPDLQLNSVPLTSQIVVTMNADHQLFVGKMLVNERLTDKLRLELSDMRRKTPSIRPTIVLNVDQSVDYGTFLKLLHEVQNLDLTIRLSYRSQHAAVSR